MPLTVSRSQPLEFSTFVNAVEFSKTGAVKRRKKSLRLAPEATEVLLHRIGYELGPGGSSRRVYGTFHYAALSDSRGSIAPIRPRSRWRTGACRPGAALLRGARVRC